MQPVWPPRPAPAQPLRVTVRTLAGPTARSLHLRGPLPVPARGAREGNGTGSACGYGRADPSLLRCAGLSGPKGVGDTVPAVPLAWGKEPPTPLPPQHSHAHTLTFFGTQLRQRITTLGSVMACACLVLGTASGLRPSSRQLCELAQRRPLRVPGGFCSRAAVPARGGRLALRPPECSRGPAAGTGSRERHAQGWSQRSQSVPTPRSTASSAPFSQPKIRWILAGVFSQRLSRHLPVGDWKDQRFALSLRPMSPPLPIAFCASGVPWANIPIFIVGGAGLEARVSLNAVWASQQSPAFSGPRVPLLEDGGLALTG